MTRLFFSAGQLRPRMILSLAASSAFFGLAETAAVHRFLGLPPEELGRHTALVAIGAALLFVLLSVFSWFALRPATRLLRELRDVGDKPSRHPDPARVASLRFPLLLSSVALGLGTVVIAAGGLVNVLVWHTSSERVVGVAISSLTVVLLACTLLYVLSRTLIRPVTLHFRNENVPAGSRVSIRSKVLLALVTTGLGASLPTGLICARRIELVRQAAGNQRLQHLADVLAYSGTVLGPDELRDLLARLSLPGVRLRLADQPGPTSSPLPSGHAAAYLAASGSLPSTTDDSFMALLMVAGLALSTLMGLLLGLNLSRDISRVASRVALIASPDRGEAAPLLAGVPQFSDVRRLAAAVNSLLHRIALINVTHFVATEKTLAANKLKMQFLANVSHDLRSPLNSILGFSELLLRDMPDDREDRRRQVLTTIQRAGGELLRLIDDVLDIAKLEAGRLSLQREDSLPASVVRQAVQELQRQGIPEAVSVTTELQAGLPTIWVDPERLSQAILHLLRFCIDRRPRGEVAVRINAQSLAEGHPSGASKLLLIRISSLGLQLSTVEQKSVFEGFRRVPGLRGLGLGLPLAKAILEMHGGALTVSSIPHVGTTFTADLPVLQRRILGQLRPVKV